MRFRRLRRYAPNSRELRVNRPADCHSFGQKRKDNVVERKKGAFVNFQNIVRFNVSIIFSRNSFAIRNENNYATQRSYIFRKLNTRNVLPAFLVISKYLQNDGTGPL